MNKIILLFIAHTVQQRHKTETSKTRAIRSSEFNIAPGRNISHWIP